MYEIPESARQTFIDSGPIMRKVCERTFSFLQPCDREEAWQNSLAIAWADFGRALALAPSEKLACIWALKTGIAQTKRGQVLGADGTGSAKWDVHRGERKGRMKRTCVASENLGARRTNVPIIASVREALPRFLRRIHRRKLLEMVLLLMDGERLAYAAAVAGLNYHAAVQARHELRQKWRRWNGEK